MNEAPYLMSSNCEFQCPLSGEKFAFTPRDNESRRAAYGQQQAHTAAEIQRLERLAGRQLTHRELVQAARCEKAAAKPVAEPAAEPENQEERKRHPFSEAVLKEMFPHGC